MTIDFLGEPNFQLKEAGKKAAHLHLLLHGGFEVPRGFVVSPSTNVAAFSDAQILDAIAKIGGFPVAVRSSGTLEDLAGASFAGQYETYLNVADVAGLRAKIELCRESGTRDNVREYIKKHGLDQSKASVSVLVQKMISPRCAGVGFSIHPLSGREEWALIEFCEGLGDKLVAGQISPSQIVADLRTGLVVENKKGDDDAQLTAADVKSLCEKLLLIQAYFKSPQDIEWAIDQSGKLWILQSRPVTKVQWRTDVDEFTNADFKDGGVSARVCTPLMYSLYRNAMQPSMQKYFVDIKLISKKSKPEKWIDMFYGRPYWNASAVKRAMFRVPGFNEKSFDEDLGIQKAYGARGPYVVPTNLKTILPVLPTALAVEATYKRQLEFTEKYGEAYLARENIYLERATRFGGVNDRDFFDLFAEVIGFHAKTEQDYFATIYNNTNTQSDFKKLVEAIDKATGGKTVLVHLMGGLTDISHMKIQRGLMKLFNVARKNGLSGLKDTQAFKDFMAENYFHADAELDLTTPRWGEVPERVVEIVAGMLKNTDRPLDPDETALKQKEVYEAEVEAVNRRLGGKKFAKLMHGSKFKKLLAQTRLYLSRREEMREYSTRCYYVVRLYVLEAAARLEKSGLLSRADDIFMLYTEDILGLMNGTLPAQETRDLIGFRKLMYEGYTDFTPPNELGRGVEQRADEAISAEGGALTLRGLGCSAGVTEGLIRIIENLQATGELKKGEILVTRFTDPGWTPVLGQVSGVITEVGGLLSHAAVIGREYGIPAILNLPGATKKLRTGQRIRMNGATGLVEILDH